MPKRKTNPLSFLSARNILLLPMVLLTFISCTRCTFPGSKPKDGKVTVLSYNVENLFDDVDNGTEYPENDPGAGEWD